MSADLATSRSCAARVGAETGPARAPTSVVDELAIVSQGSGARAGAGHLGMALKVHRALRRGPVVARSGGIRSASGTARPWCQAIRSPGLPTFLAPHVYGRSSVRADQRRTFGEYTRNEKRPASFVFRCRISCS